MNIIQFLRILRGRRWLIVFCPVFTLLGAMIVVLVAQPRYEATARVNLGFLKPDPLTGQDSIALRGAAGFFIDTQRELLKDYRVTAPVVDALGWTTNPQKIAAYNARSPDDPRDFRHWLAQQVADRVKTGSVSGSIMEISFEAPNPVEARVGAQALRASYLDYSLSSRRQEAARTAQWYMNQAEQERGLAEQAELAKAAFEKENGLVLQGDSSTGSNDIDSARLAALVNQAATAGGARNVAPISSQAGLELAQIDAQIAENATKLGPNHPEMKQLRARRALVAAVAAQEQATARAATGGDVAAVDRALRQQTARVIAQRDKVERLRQLQAQVDLRRDQYKKTAARAAELNLEAGLADTGISAFGVVVTPDKPVFPKKQLIVGGGLALGVALGLALAILVEMFNRLIRGVEDLDNDPDDSLKCLAVVAAHKPAHASRPIEAKGLLSTAQSKVA